MNSSETYSPAKLATLEFLTELLVCILIGSNVSYLIRKSKSKRMYATPLLVIRMFYSDQIFCVVFGLLAVLGNLTSPLHRLHCHWSDGLYLTGLTSALMTALITRIRTSSFTQRQAKGRCSNSKKTLHTALYLTLSLIGFIYQQFQTPDLVWLVLYHFTHLSLHLFTTFHHSNVLQKLEHVTSVKHHLMSKILNSRRQENAESADQEGSMPRPSFKASPLRLPRSASFEESTKDRAQREDNRKRLEELTSNEGLYDNITSYMTVVCCVLYVPLVLGERSVFSLYFLTLFSISWCTVIAYCVQERCWFAFYICLGWGDKIKYRKGMERSVSFNQFIECLEFDDTQVSPGPLNSRITFVDAFNTHGMDRQMQRTL